MMVKKHLDELNQIMEENGGLLRAEDVVEFAKNPKTTLHNAFEWDDKKASYKWRLFQANQLIRVAVTILPRENQEPIMVRPFVSLKEDRYNGGGYRSTLEVMESPILRKTLLDEAKEDMQTFMDKYKSLEELAEVFVAMEPLIVPPPTKGQRKYKRVEQQLSA